MEESQEFWIRRDGVRIKEKFCLELELMKNIPTQTQTRKITTVIFAAVKIIKSDLRSSMAGSNSVSMNNILGNFNGDTNKPIGLIISFMPLCNVFCVNFKM